MNLRQVVLDTETTGLDPKKGHRIIEIGCVEIIKRKITAKHFHQYIDPGREIDAGAMSVHGITKEFLRGKPFFVDIVQNFLNFIQGAELIIHNAAFDVAFIDNEFGLVGHPYKKTAHYCSVIDTLFMARKKFPGQKNNLDALCKRLEIDNSNRLLHGALLDAQLLAQVYLALTGGQTSLLGVDEEQIHVPASQILSSTLTATTNIQDIGIVIPANELELQAHQQKLAEIDKKSGGQTLWKEE